MELSGSLTDPGQAVDDRVSRCLWVSRVSAALLFEVRIPQAFGYFSCSLSKFPVTLRVEKDRGH